MKDSLLSLMQNRVDSDMDEGDIAYFNALTLQFEYLIKLSVSCLVACLVDDPDRHRYSLEHRLVRGNAIGDWSNAATSVLTGSAAQFFRQESKDLVREFTEIVNVEDWRYQAVENLHMAGNQLNVNLDSIGRKTSLRNFYQLFTTLRNKSRGHRAPTAQQCSSSCNSLAKAIRLLIENLKIFDTPWAYLHRNLSGKYRVYPLLGDCSCFDYLKKTKDVRLKNGVYIFLGAPVLNPLVFSNIDVGDILLPNGQQKNETCEILSYITNDTRRKDTGDWAESPDRLPESETEGPRELDQFGNLFGNIPIRPTGYVCRTELEKTILDELNVVEHHPIVSLTGPGGIGKTTLTLATLETLAHQKKPPYELVVWISARDIDLLQEGPKPVSPRVVSQKDIAQVTVELLNPAGREKKGFDPLEYFQQCLSRGAAGPTLFVLDNFETVDNPAEVFRWLDTHVRTPNKILITTRFREFAGDFPLLIDGMSEDEALVLIEQEAKRLAISDLMDRKYIETLYKESDGHPYVIKILLGRVAFEKRAIKPERIVAGADRILKALFERTFVSLGPAAKRTFLLLSSWRVLIPEIAVEAVSLRPGNERFDISSAIEELKRFSLIEQVVSKADGEIFIGVPLAASIFGRKKLEVSQFKIAIEEDRNLLMEFGAGKLEDAHHGVAPRVIRLIQSVAAGVNEGRLCLEDALPILEFMAVRINSIYCRLGELVLECMESNSRIVKAIDYYRLFLENAKPHEREDVWRTIANLCKRGEDVLGEVHALSEVALSPTADSEEIGNVANLLNTRIRSLKGLQIEDVWSVEIKQLIERVISVMEKRVPELTATQCSRLAWLYLNVGNVDKALGAARVGLTKDQENSYCINLVIKLEE